MKNLIGMVDFVLNQGETSTFDTDQGDWYFKEQSKLDKIRSYANFLKQPLALWMFVPCKLVDGVWVVLEEKKPFQDNYFEYQQAKDICVFEGFEVKHHHSSKQSICTADNFFHIFWNTNDFWELSKGIFTIEDLVKYNLELTPTAQI